MSNNTVETVINGQAVQVPVNDDTVTQHLQKLKDTISSDQIFQMFLLASSEVKQEVKDKIQNYTII